MTMRSIAVTVLLLCGVFPMPLGAEMVRNPDPNTLWCEDGREIAQSPRPSRNGWLNTQVTASPREEGGFTLTSTDARQKKGGLYVAVDPAYPYLVYEITGFRPVWRYSTMSIGLDKLMGHAGMVKQIRPGIYTRNIYWNRPEPAKPGWAFLNIHQVGAAVDFAYMKMVKAPENFIEIDLENKDLKCLQPGSKVKFTVRLAKEAEDVSLQFFSGRLMVQLMLNGADKLQLKPENDEGTVWSAEVELRKIGPQAEYKANAIWVKAVVLGGGLPQPLWTPIPLPCRWQ